MKLHEVLVIKNFTGRPTRTESNGKAKICRMLIYEVMNKENNLIGNDFFQDSNLENKSLNFNYIISSIVSQNFQLIQNGLN